MSKFADKLRGVLEGEPIRAINYGAIAVTFLAAKAAFALGYLPEAVPFEGIVLAVGAATTAVTEFARRFVYSPRSVQDITAAYGEAQADNGVE